MIKAVMVTLQLLLQLVDLSLLPLQLLELCRLFWKKENKWRSEFTAPSISLEIFLRKKILPTTTVIQGEVLLMLILLSSPDVVLYLYSVFARTSSPPSAEQARRPSLSAQHGCLVHSAGRVQLSVQQFLYQPPSCSDPWGQTQPPAAAAATGKSRRSSFSRWQFAQVNCVPCKPVGHLCSAAKRGVKLVDAFVFLIHL